MERYSRHLEDVLEHGELKDASLPMLRLRTPNVPHDAIPALSNVPSFCMSRAALVRTTTPLLMWVEHVVIASGVKTLVIAGTQLIDAFNVAKELHILFGTKDGEIPNTSLMTRKTIRAINVVVDKSLCARDARGDIIKGNFAVGDSADRAAALLLRSGFTAVSRQSGVRVFWEPTIAASNAARAMSEQQTKGDDERAKEGEDEE